MVVCVDVVVVSVEVVVVWVDVVVVSVDVVVVVVPEQPGTLRDFVVAPLRPLASSTWMR